MLSLLRSPVKHSFFFSPRTPSLPLCMPLLDDKGVPKRRPGDPRAPFSPPSCELFLPSPRFPINDQHQPRHLFRLLGHPFFPSASMGSARRASATLIQTAKRKRAALVLTSSLILLALIIYRYFRCSPDYTDLWLQEERDSLELERSGKMGGLVAFRQLKGAGESAQVELGAETNELTISHMSFSRV